MKNFFQKIIFEIIGQLWPEVKIVQNDVAVSYPPEKFGDYSTNVAMRLASELRKNPMDIADELKEKLDNKKIETVEEIEVVKPGHINLHLSQKSYQQVITRINRESVAFGSSEMGKGKKIQVEFVSANPTGPIHLGNGRGGPMGDSLANVFQKAGFDVEREYYVNDFGNQIKILGHSVLKDDEAQYKGNYVEQLHDEFGKEKNSDPFEIGQKAATKIVERIIQPAMTSLGIEFDNYFSEKSLHKNSQVEKAIDFLKEKQLIYEKDGALWFKSMEFGDDKDRVVKKSTGQWTYFGTDIAYHKNKFDRGFDRVINIWGADHHGDVARVKGAVEALGHGEKLEIILTQFVRVIKDGEEFKMSKRKGTYISVQDLLDEVGKDAFRFFFLMHSADTHMDFDVNLAKEQSEKNPVFYVQYAHARMSSILRKNQEMSFVSGMKEIAKLELIEHEKEIVLMQHLLRFPDLVEEVALNYEVHRLSYFAIKLAELFHSFYHECKVIDENNPELSLVRLELVKATKNVLAQTLCLMGVGAPEKM